MKQFVLIALCLFVSVGMLFSQGKAKKGDTFIFDKKAGVVSDLSGKTLFTVEYVRSVTVPGVDDYYFKNTANSTLLVAKFSSYRDPSLVSQANPNGSQGYYEMKFFSEPVLEGECRSFYLYDLVKMVHEKNLIQNGVLNLEAINEFILINGKPFSRRREELHRY